MLWFVFSILNVTLMTGYSLAYRWAMRDGRYNPNSFAIALSFGASLTSLLVALISSANFDYSSLPLTPIVISVAANVLQLVFISRANSLLEASVYNTILSVRTVIVVILAAIFLGDTITIQTLIGGIVVLVGAGLITYSKNIFSSFGKGQAYALLSALTLAIPFVSDAVALQDGFDPAAYLAMIWFLPGVILTVSRPADAKRLLTYVKDKDFLVRWSAVSASLALGVTAIFEAFQRSNNASVLAIIAQTTAITVVLFSIIFLNERSNIPKKALAATVAFAGLVIVNL